MYKILSWGLSRKNTCSLPGARVLPEHHRVGRRALPLRRHTDASANMARARAGTRQRESSRRVEGFRSPERFIRRTTFPQRLGKTSQHTAQGLASARPPAACLGSWQGHPHGAPARRRSAGEHDAGPPAVPAPGALGHRPAGPHLGREIGHLHDLRTARGHQARD